MAASTVRWFSDITKRDVPLAGGKGANLGELIRAGIPVPLGFVVTTEAYVAFLRNTGLTGEIARQIEVMNPGDPEAVQAASSVIQAMITNAPMPEGTSAEIRSLYSQLGGGPVAVRSSATAEDLTNASFAGQQTTFLNVVGAEAVVDAVRRCWASLFEPQAIAYRARNGFNDASVAIAVPVQSMVQAERSGVMFTVNPVTGSREQIVIEAVYGLGEALVSGVITPDMYVVDKETYDVVEQTLAEQDEQIAQAEGLSGNMWKPVPQELKNIPKLAGENIAALAELGLRIENHYGSPQDIEWAMVGNETYILQARPVTTA
jgi:pyruvate,water dikinase